MLWSTDCAGAADVTHRDSTVRCSNCRSWSAVRSMATLWSRDAHDVPIRNPMPSPAGCTGMGIVVPVVGVRSSRCKLRSQPPGFCRYCRGFPVGAVGSLAGFRPRRTQSKGRAPRRQHQSLIGWGLSRNGVRITRKYHDSLRHHVPSPTEPSPPACWKKRAAKLRFMNGLRAVITRCGACAVERSAIRIGNYCTRFFIRGKPGGHPLRSAIEQFMRSRYGKPRGSGRRCSAGLRLFCPIEIHR